MIVVSDTTPLRHLIAIGQADLLRKLYATVTVPTAVWNELHAESTPAFVKSWLEKSTDWLLIRSPGKPDPNFELDIPDAGEREAIQLTAELGADLLLMGDREGRVVALRLQMPVVGTVGVLERADVLRLLEDFPATLRDLETSGFYLSSRLRDTALRRYRERHTNPRTDRLS